MDRRIGFVYWIAALKGKPLYSLSKARHIASKFSLEQLTRMYKSLK